MSDPDPAAASDDAARRATAFERLLSDHASLRRRWTSLVARRSELAADDPGTPAAEDDASRCLAELVSHLDGVVAEAIRQGLTEHGAEAAFGRVAPDLRGLELAHAAAGAFPGGTAGPRFRVWRWDSNGRASALHVAGVALVLLAASTAEADDGIELVRRAAADGNGGAAVQFARFRPDAAAAAPLVRRAADAGVADACWTLYSTGWSGTGEPLTVGDAIGWLEKAAAGGHAEAQLELGRIRATGPGDLPLDHAEARKWLLLAAEQHRTIARDWLDRYGDLDPASYTSTVWLESWTPAELPPPPPSRGVGAVLGFVFLAVLAVAAFRNNTAGVFLALGFVAIVMHECGHLLAAKLAGIPVLDFTIGVGPLVRSFPVRTRGLPMRVNLRAVPLMGTVRPYVAPRGVWDHWRNVAQAKAAGRPEPPLPQFDRSEEPLPVFLHAPRARRLAFLCGGLAVNLAAALAFLWIYEQCSDVARNVTSPLAGAVPPGSVADAAGVREGDRFVAVDGQPVAGFFDVQRRLAPVTDDGVAEAPDDPPGRRVAIDVLRNGAPLRLEWVTPAGPPANDPARGAEAWGLLPPETWEIARVRPEAGGSVDPQDRILAFTWRAPDGTRHDVAADAEGSGWMLRRAFADGPVLLDVTGGRGPRRTLVLPWTPKPGGPRRLPFDLVRRKEPGPAAGIVAVASEVLTFGRDAILGLPKTMANALVSRPTTEERGWVVASVRANPWAAARIFGLIHAFMLFLNFVPVPPLDGFQILCLGVETVTGRPLPKRGMDAIRRVGFALLGLWLALNVFLIVRDAL